MCKPTPALTVIVTLIQIRMTVFVFCLCGNVWMRCQFSSDTREFMKLGMMVRIYSGLPSLYLKTHGLPVIYRLYRQWLCKRSSSNPKIIKLLAEGNRKVSLHQHPELAEAVVAFFASKTDSSGFRWLIQPCPFSHNSPLLCPSEAPELLWYCGTTCGHAGLIPHGSSALTWNTWRAVQQRWETLFWHRCPPAVMRYKQSLARH